MHEVCQDYQDILSAEYKIAEISTKLATDKRSFNTKLKMTICVTEIGTFKFDLEAIFHSIVEKNAESPLDLMDPCTAKKIYEKTTITPKYEPIEHPDYPGIYYHPNRVKKICNSMLEMAKLHHKILVVCHPLGKFIEIFEKSEESGNFTDFVSSAVEHIDYFEPLWSTCSICNEELAPNFIIKLEHFHKDFQYFLESLNLSLNYVDLVKNLPVKNEEEIQRKFQFYVEHLSFSQRFDLYQLLRSDYELFGYNPFMDLLKLY